MATTRFIDHLLEGDHASRPAAGDVPEGTLYSCTTHSLVYQSDTSTWTTWATLGGTTPDLDAVIAASSGQDIADALSGAAAPDAGNVFATMADVGGGSGYSVPLIVQGRIDGNAVTSITLGSTPTNGNTLILFTDSTTGQVSGVTQTNVTWTQMKTHTGTGAYYSIWVGKVGASASTSITMTKPGSFNTTAIIETTTTVGTPSLGVSGSMTTVNAVYNVLTVTGGTAGRLMVFASAQDNTTVVSSIYPNIPVLGIMGATVADLQIGFSVTTEQEMLIVPNGGVGAAIMAEIY